MVWLLPLALSIDAILAQFVPREYRAIAARFIYATCDALNRSVLTTLLLECVPFALSATDLGAGQFSFGWE
jgi:hypothetical protein